MSSPEEPTSETLGITEMSHLSHIVYERDLSTTEHRLSSGINYLSHLVGIVYERAFKSSPHKNCFERLYKKCYT